MNNYNSRTPKKAWPKDIWSRACLAWPSRDTVTAIHTTQMALSRDPEKSMDEAKIKVVLLTPLPACWPG